MGISIADIDVSIRDVPVSGCDECQGSGYVKVGGRCILHRAVSDHSMEELRQAMEEVEEADGIQERRRESMVEFKTRASSAFPDRWVTAKIPGYPDEDGYAGQNIAWAANTDPETYHADRDCHHLTSGPLRAIPMEVAAGQSVKYWQPDPCSHCTVDRGDQ